MHMQKEARKDKNELMLILPQSIQVNQYVALRVTLRRFKEAIPHDEAMYSVRMC